MKDVVIFHLKRLLRTELLRSFPWEKPKTLYDLIRDGAKTSEWRDMTYYWIKRLFERANWDINATHPQDLTKSLKVHKIWFVEGFPKANLPRLEADITALIYHPYSYQLEIKFKNVREVKN